MDYYCLNAVAGDRFAITSDTSTVIAGQVRQSPWVDPVLRWVAPGGQVLAVNDDDPTTPGTLNARIDTGVIAADGRYCVGVTTFGDAAFTGGGQASAGRYALRIAADAVFGDGFE